MLPRNFSKLVCETFPMPAQLRKLANVANFDLWHGPVGDENDEEGFKYPGFCDAVEVLKDWASSNLSDIWLNLETDDVSDTEPDWSLVDEVSGDPEFYPGDWCIVDVKEIKRAIFGKELAGYI